MPTYEYECQKCGHKYELFQNITALPVKKCPKCSQEAAKRLISGGGGIIFKGSGFYATDYKRHKDTRGQDHRSKKTAPKCDMAGKKDECSSCPGAM